MSAGKKRSCTESYFSAREKKRRVEAECRKRR